MKPIRKILLGDDVQGRRYLAYAEKVLADMNRRKEMFPDAFVPPRREWVTPDVYMFVMISDIGDKILISANVAGGYDLIYRDIATLPDSWALQFYGYKLSTGRAYKIFIVNLEDFLPADVLDTLFLYNELTYFSNSKASLTVAYLRGLSDSTKAIPRELPLSISRHQVRKSSIRPYTVKDTAPGYDAVTQWMKSIAAPSSYLSATPLINEQDGGVVAMTGYVFSVATYLEHTYGAYILGKNKGSVAKELDVKYQFPNTNAGMVASFPYAINPLYSASVGNYNDYVRFPPAEFIATESSQYGAFYADCAFLVSTPRNLTFNGGITTVLGYQEVWKIPYNGDSPTREFAFSQKPAGGLIEQIIMGFLVDYTGTETGIVIKIMNDLVGAIDDEVKILANDYKTFSGFSTIMDFNLGSIMGYGSRGPNAPDGSSPFWVNAWKFDIDSYGLYYHNNDNNSTYYNNYQDAIITNINGAFTVIYSPIKSRSIYKVNVNNFSPNEVIVYESDRPAPIVSGGQLVRSNVEVFVLNVLTGDKKTIHTADTTTDSITMVAPMSALGV